MKTRPFRAHAGEALRLHDGSMTQIVRVINPQPVIRHTGRVAVWLASYHVPDFGEPEGEFRSRAKRYCPFGIPRDRLWIQETYWRQRVMVEPHYPGSYQDGEFVENSPLMEDVSPWMFEEQPPGSAYVDDDVLGKSAVDHVRYCSTDDDPTDAGDDKATWVKRSPAQMPRWASRALVEVTDIRIMRLQEFTEKDYFAMGLKMPPIESYDVIDVDYWWITELEKTYDRPRLGYVGKVNPWLWVVTVKKLST